MLVVSNVLLSDPKEFLLVPALSFAASAASVSALARSSATVCAFFASAMASAGAPAGAAADLLPPPPHKLSQLLYNPTPSPAMPPPSAAHGFFAVMPTPTAPAAVSLKTFIQALPVSPMYPFSFK